MSWNKEVIRAFALGLWEFRRDCTTHFDEPHIRTYDKARELAHKFTLRRWDEEL